MELSDYQGAYSTSIESGGQQDTSLSPLIIYGAGSVYIYDTEVQVTFDGNATVTLPAFNINGLDMTGGQFTFVAGSNPQRFSGTVTPRDSPGTNLVYGGTSIYAFPDSTLDSSIDITDAFEEGDGLKLQASNENWVGITAPDVVSTTASAKPDSWLQVSATDTGIAISSGGKFWAVAAADGVLHASATSADEATIFTALLTLEGALLLKSVADDRYVQLSNNTMVLASASALAANLQFGGEVRAVDADTLVARWNIPRDIAWPSQCDMDIVYLCWQVTGGFFLAIGLGAYMAGATDEVKIGLQGLLRACPPVWAKIEEFIANPVTTPIAIAALAGNILRLAFQAGVLWKVIKFFLVLAGWWILWKIFSRILTIVLVPEAEVADLIASFATWALSTINTARAISRDCNQAALPAAPGQWTWMGGSNLAAGKGAAAAGNFPAPRSLAVRWTDASGNFWLFGGVGYDASDQGVDLNDLWKYSAGQWTLLNGSNNVRSAAKYGTLGTGAPDNMPGGRRGAFGWIDASGNLWLFGGFGFDSAGKSGYLNDLWKYSGGQWIWMGGSNVNGQAGSYGTLGIAAPENVPGARGWAASWIDANGNLWLFGGDGIDSAGNPVSLNDLWRCRGGQWTWMGGSNIGNKSATYGTLGTPAPSNVPGGRSQAVSWKDASANVWIFGGSGYDASGIQADLDELWTYSGGRWTWMSGPNSGSNPGIYGTLGQPAPDNIPGGRASAVNWAGASGNVWVFGGNVPAAGYLNDLWRFNAQAYGQWTWMGGSQGVGNQKGVYGTLGSAASSNVPGARLWAASWMDSSGNLWLFGGYGYDSAGNLGQLNDLWKYKP